MHSTTVDRYRDGRLILLEGKNPDKWAEYPRLETLNMNDTNLQTSDYWVRNASFLQSKNIQIGYTFPKAWTKK